MKKPLNKILLSLIGLLSISGLFPFSVRAGFGISPGGIFNDHLKPGTTYEQEIIVSRSDPDEELIAIIEPDLNEMNDWFTFEPGKTFVLPVGEQRTTMKIIMQVPDNATLKEYNGVIRIKATPKEEETGVSVVKGARMEVELIATEIDLVKITIRFLEIADFPSNKPLTLTVKAENEGNTQVAPSKAVLDILDLQENFIKTLEISNFTKIDPYQIQESLGTVYSGLAPGEYFSDVKVYLGNDLLREERLVFRVLEATEEIPCISSLSFANLTFLQGSLLAIPLLFLILVLVLYFVYRKNFDKDTTNKKRLAYEIVSLVLFLLLLAIVTYTVFATDYYMTPCSIEEQIEKEESTETAQVKGVQVTRDNENLQDQIPPLVVTDTTKEGIFEIFETPDTTSKVIYLANDGEEFTVLDENEEWYRVGIYNTTEGWLPKSSVKETK